MNEISAERILRRRSSMASWSPQRHSLTLKLAKDADQHIAQSVAFVRMCCNSSLSIIRRSRSYALTYECFPLQ